MDNLPPNSPVTPLPPTPPAAAPPETRNWLIGLHLSGLAGFIGIPFANILAPLIIWLVKKESSPEIDAQGKQALNFQISVVIYMIVSGLLTLILIGFLLIIAVAILWLYGMIKAAMDVNSGKPIKYPLTITFLK